MDTQRRTNPGLKRFALGACMLLVAAAGQAAPHQYTFSGNLYAVDNFYGLLPAGTSVGDPVSFAFVLDTGLFGEFTRNNGALVIIPDNAVFDYFYAQYLGGSALGEYIDGGNHNAPTDIFENRYGQHRISGPGSCCALFAGGSDNTFALFSNVPFDPGLPLGTAMTTSNVIYNAVGLTSAVWANVSLESVVAVPLPPVVWMFGPAVFALVFRPRLRAEG